MVDATTPLVVTFAHRFEFEGDATTVWDGGVIELSSDGGTTWVDVSTLGITPGYLGPITNVSGNPLAGRPAYSGVNAASPAMDTVTMDFGTQFANMTVKLRFRIGTDAGFGTAGWNIDDFAVTGIVGTPFPTQVADEGDCSTPTPDASEETDAPRPRPDAGGNPGDGDGDGGCCDAGPMSTANLGLAFGVLALAIRRRRRR
ncbi:MAG: hypothetical protein WKG01_20410 [Kofleriaceae bacterium]